jgi:hypothetical protein
MYKKKKMYSKNDHDYYHRLWVDWALFVQRGRDFKVSLPGVLTLTYGNLLIWVYLDGTVHFHDKKTKEILWEDHVEDPGVFTFYGTNVYKDDMFLFDYNTRNRQNNTITRIK